MPGVKFFFHRWLLLIHMAHDAQAISPKRMKPSHLYSEVVLEGRHTDYRVSMDMTALKVPWIYVPKERIMFGRRRKDLERCCKTK